VASQKLLQSGVWRKAVAACAEPARPRHVIAGLPESSRRVLARATAEHARILCALFSGSEWAGEAILKHPDWLEYLETPAHPRRKQGLKREVEPWLASSAQAALAQLRRFKQREMLRIAARDLGRLADAQQITLEISNLADVCLSAVLRLCSTQLEARFGKPYHRDADENWVPTEFSVLGLGKLGGEELNYSSDVDLMFLYSEEGSAFREPPRKGTQASLSTHQYYKRLVQDLVAELPRPAEEGVLYRVDLRLRPEGDAGPLVRSLSGYENYYAQWGQTWERMMLIKTRCVAGSE
jgi:[glutamine synthetase] adenylyltransferase / [glutamine synthetase]-adenylyl-L-tyrosine phosphorylase